MLNVTQAPGIALTTVTATLLLKQYLDLKPDQSALHEELVEGLELFISGTIYHRGQNTRSSGFPLLAKALHRST